MGKPFPKSGAELPFYLTASLDLDLGGGSRSLVAGLAGGANPTTAQHAWTVIDHGQLPRRNTESGLFKVDGDLIFSKESDRCRLGFRIVADLHAEPIFGQIIGRNQPMAIFGS